MGGRHLLSHSSGLGYDVTNPNLMRYRKYRGEEPMTMSTSIVSQDGGFPVPGEGGRAWVL
jgi:CubicO group peptidase (beta-lactamase class C family)